MPYKPMGGGMKMPQYQAPLAQVAPQQPGLGEQLAKSAASKLAAQQAAKLGLQAAGTAAAGPIGGALGSAAGDLAGPLAGQLVGKLFNKGGPVYAQGGQWIDFNTPDVYSGLSDKAKREIELYDDMEWTAGVTGGPKGKDWRGQSGWWDKNAKNYIDVDQDGDWDIKMKDGKPMWFQAAEKKAKEEGIPLEKAKEEIKKEIEAKTGSAPVAPAPIDRAVGGSRGVSGTWNVPLGKIGDWDIGTSGHYAGDVKMDDGTKQKGNWSANLSASTPTNFLSNIFGGDPNAVAKSADIYNQSVAKDIAEENKGSSAYWKSKGYSDEEALDKIMEHLGMSDGGKVTHKKKSIWDSIKDKVTGDFSKRKQLMGGQQNQQKPAYKAMGGMTPGPLGLSDMQALGKGQDVSKVMYKKKGGEVEDTMEVSYHTPLAYQKPSKPTGE